MLVAAPDTLGQLRPVLHSEVTDRVIGEVPKNLTNMPLDKMESHIHDALEQ